MIRGYSSRVVPDMADIPPEEVPAPPVPDPDQIPEAPFILDNETGEGVVQLLEDDRHKYEQPFGTIDLQDLRDLDILAYPHQPQQHLNTVPVINIKQQILELLSPEFAVPLPKVAHAVGPDVIPQAGPKAIPLDAAEPLQPSH